MSGNASMSHEPNEICRCGHQNILHGKSECVDPGCDRCDCDIFEGTGEMADHTDRYWK